MQDTTQIITPEVIADINVEATQDNAFALMGLHESLVKALTDAGYTTPTPIQAQAIPHLMTGADLMASAQTGTGKTAAFMLPALHHLTENPGTPGKGPRVLVLTPTRELAQQVTEAAQKYGRNLRRAKVVSVVGGVSYTTQNRLLTSPYEILVATPGRLIDQMQSGRIDFSRLEMLVLDEADRMLDMGFSDDVMSICAATPRTRQTALFSATLDGVVGRLADQILKNPAKIQIAAQHARHTQIEQKLHYVDDLGHKNRLLDHLVRDEDIKQAIVFTATKRDADLLADDLVAAGQPAAALHGDMSQRDRNRTLVRLRKGEIRVLVATDIAARGIDVPGISHVINFDLPKVAEDYVHRIGRTGRAGASGIAISFAGRNDQILLKRIERFTGQPIPTFEIAGHEARFKPREGGGGFGGGDRNSRPGGPRREGGFGGGNRTGGYAGNRDRNATGGFGGGDRTGGGGFGGGDRTGGGGYAGNRDRNAGGGSGFGGNRPPVRDGAAPRDSYPPRDGFASRGPRPGFGQDRAAAPATPRDDNFGNSASYPQTRTSGAAGRSFSNDRPRQGEARPAGDRGGFGGNGGNGNRSGGFGGGDRGGFGGGDRGGFGGPKRGGSR